MQKRPRTPRLTPQEKCPRCNVGSACGSVAEMINLSENMDCVDLHPAFSAEEYGAFHIDLAQDEFADEMDALENSETPSKSGFADYISDLECCLDIKACYIIVSGADNIVEKTRRKRIDAMVAGKSYSLVDYLQFSKENPPEESLLSYLRNFLVSSSMHDYGGA